MGTALAVLLNLVWAVLEWQFSPIPAVIPRLIVILLLVSITLLTLSFGWLLTLRSDHRRMGALFLLAGIAGSLNNISINLVLYSQLVAPIPGIMVAAWLQDWLWIVLLAMVVLILLLFPNGHVPTRGWRPLLWVIVAYFGTFLTIFIAYRRPLGNSFERFEGLTAPANPTGVLLLPPAVESILTGSLPLFLPLFMLAAVASLIYRLRRSQVQTRQQVKWVLYGAGLAGTLIALQGVAGLVAPASPFVQMLQTHDVAGPLANLILVIVVGFALLKVRLYAIDLIVNRTLVYLGLTAVIVLVYVGIVAGLGNVLQARGSLVLSITAAGAVAALFQPLQVRLQKGVNRLMFGQRDDPVGMLTQLTTRLETADDIIATLVDTIAMTLKLPYVAIHMASEVDAPAASSGVHPGHVEVIPLQYRQQPIGLLVVAPRSPIEQLGEADRSLLYTVANLASTTLHALRLRDELQMARQRLVTAREEERRRIRRDLHDGLGPVLASLAMQADTARELLQTHPAQADSILTETVSQATSAVEEIRRIAHGLRPPALDDLGLAAALRQMAGSYRRHTAIYLEIPPTLPPLAAALETAVYRITQEALANVARHADAGECVVQLAVDNDFCLTIRDNGRGWQAGAVKGVGLHSMQERVAELGGRLQVTSTPGEGTCIEVSLPLAPDGEILSEDN